MSVYQSETYCRDIETVLKSIQIGRLCNKTVLVTGASGLVCSAVVDILLFANRKEKTNIRIWAAGRSIAELQKRFSPFSEKDGLFFAEYDPETFVPPEQDMDYLICGAGPSSPDLYVKRPVDTMIANFVGTKRILDYAKECAAAKTVFISSSEVNGTRTGNQPLREDTYGIIDPLRVRSSYAMAKKAAETLCISYKEQYGCNVCIVRPGHIYGPTARKGDERVSSAFAFDAVSGKDLVMRSSGNQIRSYCYCLDCASAILFILMNGENGECYNISNRDSIVSIREMAEIYSKAAGVRAVVAEESKPERQDNPMQNSSLDAEKLEDLGWRGLFSAQAGMTHTIRILSEMQRERNGRD